MVQITVNEDTLALEVQGMHKFFAMKSRLDIPLRHVSGVSADSAVARHPQGWRELGTHLPGLLTAGTIRHDGKRLFWDVHDPENAVVINLLDDQYDQLIVEVANPAATVQQIRAAIS